MATVPLAVSIILALLIVASLAGIIAIFVAGILAVRKVDINGDDDDDRWRGGDEGFTPAPWPQSGDHNPLEQEQTEKELAEV